MLIYTCPECGNDLQCLVLTSLPPKTRYKCWRCGWEFTEKPEQIIRQPFTSTQVSRDSVSIS